MAKPSRPESLRKKHTISRIPWTSLGSRADCFREDADGPRPRDAKWSFLREPNIVELNSSSTFLYVLRCRTMVRLKKASGIGIGMSNAVIWVVVRKMTGYFLGDDLISSYVYW